jgi:hypothetical protein
MRRVGRVIWLLGFLIVQGTGLKGMYGDILDLMGWAFLAAGGLILLAACVVIIVGSIR